MEMYEQQEPFKLTDFITMSYFLNQFLYKAVLTNLFGERVNLLLSLAKPNVRESFLCVLCHPKASFLFEAI